MKKELSEILEKNRNWSERMIADNPEFFERLKAGQKPQFLWIGCSDSRVPSSKIIDADPGEVFVHRNIANLVHQQDLNILSVLQYSVEVLKVRHILVCGHYGCGGIKASLETTDHGLIDNWIRPVKQLYEEHKSELQGLPEDQVLDRLCEWNVQHQVANVGRSTILQKAWHRGQEIMVHGLIYRLTDGKLIDLSCSLSQANDVSGIYRIR